MVWPCFNSLCSAYYCYIDLCKYYLTLPLEGKITYTAPTVHLDCMFKNSACVYSCKTALKSMGPCCPHSVTSVSQTCPILCNPMGCSTPGFPIPHQLPDLAETQVHWVGDTIHPSHPLSSPSPPAFNLSHHQSLPQ